MIRQIGCLTFVLAAVLIAAPASAKRFHNAYVSFDLPPNWKCEREHTETVCTSRFSKNAKEAMIILTAKEVGPTDTFAVYLSHLKSPKTIVGKDGRPVQSKVLHVRERNISNHQWIDGMHLGSEVTSYYTRYLATIKDRIAILVTFSAHKEHYTKYSKDFINAVQSLRVVATKDLLANRPNMALRKSGETIGAPIGQVLPAQLDTGEYPPEQSGWLNRSTTQLLGLLLLALAIGIFVYMKMNSKKKGSARRTPRPRR